MHLLLQLFTTAGQTVTDERKPLRHTSSNPIFLRHFYCYGVTYSDYGLGLRSVLTLGLVLGL